MPKVAPSNSIKLVVAAAILALASCARDAPMLPNGSFAPPPAVTPDERTGRCAALATNIATLRGEMATINQVIAGHRHEDQVVGYLAGVLFPPLALAIDQQKAQKAALDDRQGKVDEALAEQHALACPSS